MCPNIEKLSVEEYQNTGGAYAGHVNIGLGKKWEPIFASICEIVFNETGVELESEYSLISAGANLNLPNSFNQRFHTDGDYTLDNLIIHFYIGDVCEANGPHELVPLSNKSFPTYANFIFGRLSGKLKTSCLTGKSGQIIIRYSNLWHRGTSNTSQESRYAGTFVMANKALLNKVSGQSLNQKLGAIQSNGFKATNFGRVNEVFSCRFGFALGLARFLLSLRKKSFWLSLCNQ